MSLIESKELAEWKGLLTTILANQVMLFKRMDELNPKTSQSNTPGFISIEDACIDYYTTKTTIHKKLKLFKAKYGRDLDRLQSGDYKLLNEAELQQALALRGTYNGPVKKDINTSKGGKKKTEKFAPSHAPVL